MSLMNAARPCALCGARPAKIFTLCLSCRQASVAIPTTDLMRVAGGPAARPLPRAEDEDRQRAAHLTDEDSEGEEIGA